MGLDCYLQKDLGLEDDGRTWKSEELWYGRKTNALHGWMQRRSGIDAGDFNCERLYLDAQALDDLEKDCALGSVLPTNGFFFGSPEEREYIQGYTEEFIKTGREALAAGDKIYYFSWW